MSSIKVYGETGLDAVNKPGGEEYMVPIVQVPVVSPLVLPTPDPSPSPAATAITTTPTATQEPTPSSVSLEVSSAVAVEGNGAVNGSAVVASADPSTSTVDDHSTVSKSPSNSTVSSESSSTLNVTKATPVVSEVPSFSSNITSSLSPEVTQTPSPSDTPVSTPSLPPTSVPTLAPNEEKPVFEPAVPPIPSLSTSPTQQPSELPSALLEANISTVGSLLVAVALNISDGLNATTVSANASANVSAVPVEPVADLETTPSPSPLVSQAAASDDPLPTPTATSTAVEDASRDASLSNVTSPSTDGTVAVEEDIDVSDLIGTAVVVEQAPAPSVPAPVNENMMHTMPPHTLWASAGVPLEMASKTSTALKSFSDRCKSLFATSEVSVAPHLLCAVKALEFEQEVVRKYLGEFQAKFNVVIERVQTGIDTNKADITNLVRERTLGSPLCLLFNVPKLNLLLCMNVFGDRL